jgi:hypothetical protein
MGLDFAHAATWWVYWLTLLPCTLKSICFNVLMKSYNLMYLSIADVAGL